MLCLGPADRLAAHLHVLSSTAMCHRVPGFVPDSVPPRTALCFGLCTAVQGAPIRRIRPRQSNRPHGSEAHSANEPPQAGIGRASAWACCARRKESPNPSYSGWSTRAQQMRARDSRHRAASAGLFAPAGEHASRGTLRAMRMGCACSARLQLLPETWNSAALVACACRTICTSVRSDRGDNRDKCYRLPWAGPR